MLLDWFPNPDHASLYLAQSEGDFTSAGLQGVTLQAPSGSQDALKLVSTGAMPLGISYEPNVVTAASQGLDVEAVAALVPTPLNTLLISSQSGIKSIKGLAGKKIGTNGDPVETATLNTILKRNGVNPSSTQQIAVSEGLIPAMLSGNVQAIISGYRNVEEIQLKLKGQPPVAFNVEDEGMPTYDELVIVAQKSKLASDPGYAAMVRDFLAGLAKGDAAAQASSSAAIAALKPVVGRGRLHRRGHQRDGAGHRGRLQEPARLRRDEHRQVAGVRQLDAGQQAHHQGGHRVRRGDRRVPAGKGVTGG